MGSFLSGKFPRKETANAAFCRLLVADPVDLFQVARPVKVAESIAILRCDAKLAATLARNLSVEDVVAREVAVPGPFDFAISVLEILPSWRLIPTAVVAVAAENVATSDAAARSRLRKITTLITTVLICDIAIDTAAFGVDLLDRRRQ